MTRLIFGVTDPPAASDHRPYVYVAFDSAGHVRRIIDDSGLERNVAEAAAWAIEGLTVDRQPNDDGRLVAGVFECSCPTADQPGLGL